MRASVASWAHGDTSDPDADGQAMPAPGDANDPNKANGMVSAIQGESTEEDGSGSIFFKDDGGARGAVDPRRVAAELGPGRALDGGVRSRMERAFGRDFSTVRIHADDRAASLAGQLSASAFTVGHDVAFDRGRYRPGTIPGDALLAQELAHVVQQGKGTAVQAARQSVEAPGGSHEKEADRAAENVVRSLWDPSTTGAAARSDALPVVGAGLRLQRCKGCQDTPEPPKTPLCPTSDGLHFFPADGILVFIRGGKRDRALSGARRAGGVEARRRAERRPHDGGGVYHRRSQGSPRLRADSLPYQYLDMVEARLGDPHRRPPREERRLLQGKSIDPERPGHPRAAIIDKNQKLYGSATVPSTWLFNDFGPKQFRYYRDVNHNKRFDPGIDVLMPEMIHTTPGDEALKAQGQPPAPLGESHGCVHVEPSDRDAMQKAGILSPGTPFIIHGYNETYQCP